MQPRSAPEFLRPFHTSETPAFAVMSDPSSQITTAPWHAAYPPPKSDPASIRRTELLQWFYEGQNPGKDFMLIDLRKTDHEVSSRRFSKQYENFRAGMSTNLLAGRKYSRVD